MATTAGDAVFVDTNILVYANIATAPFHTVAEQKLHDLFSAGTELWISRQILREYLVTLTRPQIYAAPPPLSVLKTQVIRFQTLMNVAEDNRTITDHLLDLLAAIPIGGKQVHDANIVATMQAYGIPKLLTHNTADFARFASVITLMPLTP